MNELTRRIAEADAAPGSNGYDVERVREDFPILKRMVHKRPLVYLDNAASAEKPRQVSRR